MSYKTVVLMACAAALSACHLVPEALTAPGLPLGQTISIDVLPRHAFYVHGDTEENGPFAEASNSLKQVARLPWRPNQSLGMNKVDSAIMTGVGDIAWFYPPQENQRGVNRHRSTEWEISCAEIKSHALAHIHTGHTIDLYGYSRGASVVIYCAPELAEMGYQIGTVALINGGNMTAAYVDHFTHHATPGMDKVHAGYIEQIRDDDPFYNGQLDETIAVAEQVFVISASRGSRYHRAMTTGFEGNEGVDFVSYTGDPTKVELFAAQYVRP